jgi:hypothetical protein
MRYSLRGTALLAACAPVAVVLLLAACGTTTSGASAADATGTPSGPTPSVLGDTVTTVCPGKPQYAKGSSRLVLLGVPAIVPRNDCTPSYTAQDVVAYVNQGLHLGKIAVVGRPTVTRVLFTTSRHAGELMQGQSVGLADDAVVCYVELSGTFTGGSAPGVTPTVTHTAAIVFDGHSGNMLGIEA